MRNFAKKFFLVLPKYLKSYIEYWSLRGKNCSMMRKEALRFLLALKIKELRLSQSYSLKDLAKKSQLSVSYLNEIEKAKKYPKADKLMALAAALGTTYDDLVSIRVKSKIQPLVEFYQKGLYKKLPMSEFGISETDLFDLVSYDPGKFGSLLITLQELTRTYDIDLSNINRAALRAYQETNINYFEDLEQKVDEFIKLRGWTFSRRVDVEHIKSILINEYNYSIDEETLTKTEGLENTRSVFKKGEPNKLLVNKRLGANQKLFVYTRELASCFFGGKRQVVTGAGAEEENYQDVFHDFKASYFAGALMIPRDLIVQDLREFFSLKSFDPMALDRIMEKYNAGSEVFFHRLSQVLPRFFGLKNLFFLRSNHHITTDKFSISKEMHLARLHKPHGSRLKEKYCRRWITIYLLKDFLQVKDKPRIISSQISSMIGTDDEYLCLSVARPSKLKKDTNSCITIGIQINDNAREEINFLKDNSISRKIVGQTCERCPDLNCKERAAEPVIFLKNEREKSKKEKLLKVFESL